MPDIEVIKARVQERLVATNHSGNSASNAAGLGASYVNDILSGKNKSPGGLKLARLAAVLDCDAGWLGGGIARAPHATKPTTETTTTPTVETLMSASTPSTKALTFIGFAVYAPSGAISWRSVENNREASISAYLNGSNPAIRAELWRDMEAAGFTCEEVRIAPTSAVEINEGDFTEVFVNAVRPKGGGVPKVEKIIGDEFHPTADAARDRLRRMRDNGDTSWADHADTYRALLTIVGQAI
jgi:hypothetical protein